MAQDIQETVSDLDDRTKDVDVTDISNDVDTQELIRSDNQSYQGALRSEAVADRVQARRHAEEEHGQRMRHQANLDAQVILGAQNAATHTNNLNQQTVRHTDHTLIDLHNPKVQQDSSDLG